MASQHHTEVTVLSGPSNDDILVPGETFYAKVSMVPQNWAPTAITQIFLYAGPRDGEKEVQKLMNSTPGSNPPMNNFDFEYTVPENVLSGHDRRVSIEFGWGMQMQYTWADAMRLFRQGQCEIEVLRTLQVMPGTWI